jgi:endonuclease G
VKTPQKAVVVLSPQAQLKIGKSVVESVSSHYTPGASYNYAFDLTSQDVKRQTAAGATNPLPVPPRPATIPPVPNFYKTPQSQAHFQLLKSAVAAGNLRIVGGNKAGFAEFLDCVAVLDETNKVLASGTLIGKNVVLTVGHVANDPHARFIFIGADAKTQSPKSNIPIARAIPHPDYVPSDPHSSNDLGLLILAVNVDTVPPRVLATKAEIDAAAFLEVVGFGFIDLTTNRIGVKTKVLVPISSNPFAVGAAATQQDNLFGIKTTLDIVAGGNGLDSCQGDSGGPAYIAIGSDFKLAGATSRSTADSAVQCGGGGVYSRVDPYRDWIAGTAKANGGALP